MRFFAGPFVDHRLDIFFTERRQKVSFPWKAVFDVSFTISTAIVGADCVRRCWKAANDDERAEGNFPVIYLTTKPDVEKFIG